jgi:hypothetical protein
MREDAVKNNIAARRFTYCLTAFLGMTCLAFHPTEVNPRAEIFKQFEDRVKKYVELQKELDKKLPHLPKKTDARTIAAHRDALAKSIQQARADAHPGDIFIPEVQPLIKQIIQANLKGPTGKAQRTTILKENPKKDGAPAPDIQLKVNAPYPGKEPLSTVPPPLLLNLPQLPEGVTYRFVGRDLILLDSKSALIIDYMKGAFV